jgi:hypothetical protein
VGECLTRDGLHMLVLSDLLLLLLLLRCCCLQVVRSPTV